MKPTMTSSNMTSRRMTSVKLAVVALTAALFLLMGLPATAQTTAQFEVRVAVIDSCTISANDLDFGNYDPNSAVPTVGTTTITTNCTLLTAYDVGIDAGTRGTAVNDRKMIDDATTSETLDYSLSCAGVGVPACAVNWGNTPGTDTFFTVGTGLDVPTVVTGTIAAGQQVTPGNYRDTPVTATVFF